MNTEPELLNERLERLAIVLDEIMPKCALLVRDAIEPLKEQEAVEPIKKEMVEITARYEFDCPCGAPLLIGQPYCADCGKLVKWE